MPTVLTEARPAVSDPDDRLGQLQIELEGLEGRDLEIWGIGASLGVVIVAALLLSLDPTLVWNFEFFIRKADHSPELVLGLFGFILLLNAYLYYERRLIRNHRRELLRQLLVVERSSQIDPLTGTFNRRCLEQLLRKEMSRADRRSNNLSVVLVDVNDFKSFNTRFGHLVGDQVLAQVSHVLAGAMRGSDTVVRYGGDEFLILLGETNREQAEIVVNRIDDHLRAWNRREKSRGWEVTVTCGIAEFVSGMPTTELIRLADEEMLAKKEQRATVTTVSR